MFARPDSTDKIVALARNVEKVEPVLEEKVDEDGPTEGEGAAKADIHVSTAEDADMGEVASNLDEACDEENES